MFKNVFQHLKCLKMTFRNQIFSGFRFRCDFFYLVFNSQKRLCLTIGSWGSFGNLNNEDQCNFILDDGFEQFRHTFMITKVIFVK